MKSGSGAATATTKESLREDSMLVTGAFINMYNTSVRLTQTYTQTFKAILSNNIYSKSSIVQPSSIQALIIIKDWSAFGCTVSLRRPGSVGSSGFSSILKLPYILL